MPEVHDVANDSSIGSVLFGLFHEIQSMLKLLVSDNLGALEHVSVLSGSESNALLAATVARRSGSIARQACVDTLRPHRVR